MATKIQEIHDKLTNDTIYPVTKAQAVYMPDNTTTVDGAITELAARTDVIELGQLTDLNIETLLPSIEAGKVYHYWHEVGANNSYASNWAGAGYAMSWSQNDVVYLQEIEINGSAELRRQYDTSNGTWSKWHNFIYPEVITLTQNSSYCNLVGNTRAYRIGRVVYAALNIYLTQSSTPTGVTLASGFPPPMGNVNWAFAFGSQTSGASFRAFINSSGNLVPDGAVSGTGNRNASITYISSVY